VIEHLQTPGALPPGDPAPPYPRDDRQRRFISLGDRLARIAAASADAHDRAGSFPHDTFAALREAGYLTLTIPETDGGLGASPLEYLLAQERLARGSAAVALAVSMHLKVVADYVAATDWRGDVRDEFLRGVVERGYLVNNIASEAELGSPNRGGSYATTARRTDRGFVIDGHKIWSTLAPALTHAAVGCSVEQPDGTFKTGRILVPMTLPGVRVVESWDSLGMRATGSHDIVFTQVEVPAANELPADTAGGGPELKPLSLHMAAVYLGVASVARDFTVAYARERTPSALGAPIATTQFVQHRVARMQMLHWQASSALFGSIEDWYAHPEQRDSMTWRFAAAKHLVTNHAIEITDLAMRVVGAAAMNRAYPLERYFRDVRAGLGNPPGDDVALTTVGKAALGLD
jgi:alkylation response protein AidB-like acyl-CoA dehydrogenase